MKRFDTATLWLNYFHFSVYPLTIPLSCRCCTWLTQSMST